MIDRCIHTPILDTFEAVALSPQEAEMHEILESLNTYFTTRTTPENGFYGIAEVIKGDGLSEITGKTPEGHIFREYLRDGQVYKRRINLGDHKIATIDCDDNGNAYLKTVSRLADNKSRVIESVLTPNTTIVKGNCTSVIDAFGRVTQATAEHLQLKPTGEPHGNIAPGVRDAAFRVTDDQGHLIASRFFGSGSKENIVAMDQGVNRGPFKQVENLAAKLVEEGHDVEYKVKVNYSGTDKRPTSFEPKIKIDGKEFELPDGLKKIYNGDINGDSLSDAAHRLVVNAGETFGLAHEYGMKSGKLAAGLTFAASTYSGVSSLVNGEISADEMVIGILEDTALAGGAAYGTTFISTAVAQAMSGSANELVQAVGGSCAPALVVSFGVQSFGDISDFAQGKNDASELAYNLGEHAAGIGGGFVGGAAAGAALGAVAGPGGAAVGSVIGGVVGCAVASEAYATAVELGAEGVEAIGNQAQALANATVDYVRDNVPERIEDVRASFNDFFSDNNLPFSV